MFLNNYVEKNISDWYWTSQEKKPKRGRRGRGEGGGVEDMEVPVVSKI